MYYRQKRGNKSWQQPLQVFLKRFHRVQAYDIFMNIRIFDLCQPLVSKGVSINPGQIELFLFLQSRIQVQQIG